MDKDNYAAEFMKRHSNECCKTIKIKKEVSLLKNKDQKDRLSYLISIEHSRIIKHAALSISNLCDLSITAKLYDKSSIIAFDHAHNNSAIRVFTCIFGQYIDFYTKMVNEEISLSDIVNTKKEEITETFYKTVNVMTSATSSDPSFKKGKLCIEGIQFYLIDIMPQILKLQIYDLEIIDDKNIDIIQNAYESTCNVLCDSMNYIYKLYSIDRKAQINTKAIKKNNDSEYFNISLTLRTILIQCDLINKLNLKIIDSHMIKLLKYESLFLDKYTFLKIITIALYFIVFILSVLIFIRINDRNKMDNRIEANKKDNNKIESKISKNKIR